jgi:hypothetical protein
MRFLSQSFLSLWPINTKSGDGPGVFGASRERDGFLHGREQTICCLVILSMDPRVRPSLGSRGNFSPDSVRQKQGLIVVGMVAVWPQWSFSWITPRNHHQNHDTFRLTETLFQCHF